MGAARGRGRRDVPAAGGRLPDFVVIGAMRAGTTSLARYLGAHPGIGMPSKKEIHFFDWNWDRGLDWYRAAFADAAPGAIVGEATPIYMVYADAMERMAAACPDLRLVAVLRDPVDRAFSHYNYNRMLGFEPLSFEGALAAEIDRPPATTDRRTYDYVERGRYLPQLERAATLYPCERLHVVLFEELVSRPRETYAAVCRFLGVDDAFVPSNLGETMNAHSAYRSKALARAIRALPKPLQRPARRFNRTEIAYAPMAEATRRTLEQRFAADNESLGAWLGRERSPWPPRAKRSGAPLATAE